jgi:hypothetical protein
MTSENYYFDFSYQMKNICRQKRGKQEFSIPPARAELRESPYTNFSKLQLDMRRKVEILKYSSSSVNSQTNSLTKSQKWRNLVNGIVPAASATTMGPSQICDTVTLSSSCGIPGEVFQIYEDVNVPLYNYKNKQNIYSIYPDAPSLNWSSRKDNNISITSKKDEIVTTIITRLPSDSLTYKYNISIPLALSASIFVKLQEIHTFSFELYINNIELRVYYNEYILSSYAPINTIANKHVFTINNSYDVEVYNIMRFLGNISFENITLYNENQYIFDIKLHVDYSVIPTNDTICGVTESNLTANYLTTTDNLNSIIPKQKGSVTSNPVASEYTIFSLTNVG